jgi:NAD(P)-dependent dehydrogenase (short-subunit alcohol dehydrogenase family)
LRSNDEKLTGVVVDVASQEEVSTVFARAMERLGGLDAVVNIAGIGHTG